MITGTIRLFFWLLLLPFRLVWWIVWLVLRLTTGTLKGTFRLGVGTGKLGNRAASGIGYTRILAFGAGVGVGYLLGSPTARAQVLGLVDDLRGGTPADFGGPEPTPQP